MTAALWLLWGCGSPDAVDADGDGATTASDCDDRDPGVSPWAEETCDGKDNDCDGQIDEGVAETYFPDADGDGSGDLSGESISSCQGIPDGYTTQGRTNDCDDTDPLISASELDVCGDGVDNDCDGAVDEPECVTTLIRGASTENTLRLGSALRDPVDLDGDGRADLVVGAGAAAVADQAAVLIWSAPPVGVADPSSASAILRSSVPMGIQNGAFFDISAPDDASGYPAMLIASADTGALWVIDGPFSGELVLQEEARAQVSGSADEDYDYLQVEGIGDLNGDGWMDVLLGVPGAGAEDAGAAWLLLGPLSGESTLTDADVVLWGTEEGDNLGAAIAGLEDLDGDGLVDVAVGAPQGHVLEEKQSGAGGGYVAVFTSPLSGSSAVADAEALLQSASRNQLFGISLSSGDLDADGYTDLVISDTSQVMVFSGATLTATDDPAAAADARVEIGGSAIIGDAMPAVADINQDGAADILLGTERNIGCAVLLGPLDGVVALEASADFRFQEPLMSSNTLRLASGGDLDGDGRTELVVGYSGYAQPWSGEGAEAIVGQVGILEW